MYLIAAPDPDNDLAAKRALWGAIHQIADDMGSKWGLEAFLSHDCSRPINSVVPMPTLTIWKLAESLSVFIVLRDADEVRTDRVFNLRGRIPNPINYIKRGEPFYLWTQKRMVESLSGFTGAPDIAITMTSNPPSRANAVDVIEVKSGKPNSRLIRQEFAKGFDLKVRSYCIWSYIEPAQEVVEGARLLGIELAPLGFSSADRDTALNPGGLISIFEDHLTTGRNSANFERVLQQNGIDSLNKRQQRLQHMD